MAYCLLFNALGERKGAVYEKILQAAAGPPGNEAQEARTQAQREARPGREGEASGPAAAVAGGDYGVASEEENRAWKVHGSNKNDSQKSVSIGTF